MTVLLELSCSVVSVGALWFKVPKVVAAVIFLLLGLGTDN